MKKIITALFISLSIILALPGCGEKQTAEQKIQAQVKDKVHALTADERPRATANAKTYFEKEFPVASNGQLGKERGVFNECRPSDSNFNGLVTCKGLVPQINGGFKEITRYCGYTPDLVGCSDEDTVK